MTAYLIAYGAHPGERFRAVAYATRPKAVAAAAQQPVGDCALVIDNERDITLGLPTLTVAFNALTGNNVARFESLPVAKRRFMAALAALPPPTEPVTGEEVMAKKTKTEGETETKKNGRTVYSDDMIITVVAESNPQRQGTKSHSMHEKYQNGMTVKQAMEAGVSKSHIIYGVHKGFIALTA